MVSNACPGAVLVKNVKKKKKHQLIQISVFSVCKHMTDGAGPLQVLLTVACARSRGPAIFVIQQ